MSVTSCSERFNIYILVYCYYNIDLMIRLSCTESQNWNEKCNKKLLDKVRKSKINIYLFNVLDIWIMPIQDINMPSKINKNYKNYLFLRQFP